MDMRPDYQKTPSLSFN